MAAADAASPTSAPMPVTPSTQAAPSRTKPAHAQVQTPQIAAHAVTPAAAAAPAPATLAPAPAAERARSAEVPAATGKFFEPNDVDVSPQIAKRIEPLLPADLRDRRINDVVIVRVLVSQSGDPSLVRLLRKSKHGPSLDEAVVAAVTQWRFSPAKRRGEAVSSWYNVGVPLGQTN
jgi:protein TonB